MRVSDGWKDYEITVTFNVYVKNCKFKCGNTTLKEQEFLEVQKNRKQDFEVSLKSGNLKQIAEADVHFHDVIYDATCNPKLINLLNNLREQIYRYRVEYIKKAENHPILIEEHEAIYKALSKRDKQAAKASICRHVENQATAVKQVIMRQE